MYHETSDINDTVLMRHDMNHTPEKIYQTTHLLRTLQGALAPWRVRYHDIRREDYQAFASADVRVCVSVTLWRNLVAHRDISLQAHLDAINEYSVTLKIN